MIEIRSPAIRPNQEIPRRHVRDGDDLSPPLEWSGLPDDTAEVALICDDPDAPTPEPFVHWVLYGLPPDTRRLEEDTRQGVAGTNDWGESGYGGPQPPAGHGTHHYRFRVYALDQELGLPAGAGTEELLEAMRDHVLDQGELVGTYAR